MSEWSIYNNNPAFSVPQKFLSFVLWFILLTEIAVTSVNVIQSMFVRVIMIWCVFGFCANRNDDEFLFWTVNLLSPVIQCLRCAHSTLKLKKKINGVSTLSVLGIETETKFLFFVSLFMHTPHLSGISNAFSCECNAQNNILDPIRYKIVWQANTQHENT